MGRRDANEDEFEQLTARLRSERPHLDAVRLDEIKRTTIARAQRDGGGIARRRLAVAALTVGLMAAGTGGVIAAGGAGHSTGNAATAQYGGGPNQEVKGAQERRSFRIHLKIPHHAKLKSVTIKLNGKTIEVLKGRKATATFTLDKLPCARGLVKITAVTTSGKKVTETRLLLACPT